MLCGTATTSCISPSISVWTWAQKGHLRRHSASRPLALVRYLDSRWRPNAAKPMNNASIGVLPRTTCRANAGTSPTACDHRRTRIGFNWCINAGAEYRASPIRGGRWTYACSAKSSRALRAGAAYPGERSLHHRPVDRRGDRQISGPTGSTRLTGLFWLQDASRHQWWGPSNHRCARRKSSARPKRPDSLAAMTFICARSRLNEFRADANACSNLQRCDRDRSRLRPGLAMPPGVTNSGCCTKRPQSGRATQRPLRS